MPPWDGQDLANQLDADGASTDDYDSRGGLELSRRGRQRGAALGKRRLRLGWLDGVGIRRAGGQHEVIEMQLPLCTLFVPHADTLTVGAGHGGSEQLVACRR